MLPTDAVASCPSDGCPLRAFDTVKAPLGFVIELHGCRYCNFNYVVAVARDASGHTRPVGQWSVDPAGGRYVLAREYSRTPPGWLELVCAALSQHQQQSEQGNST